MKRNLVYRIFILLAALVPAKAFAFGFPISWYTETLFELTPALIITLGFILFILIVLGVLAKIKSRNTEDESQKVKLKQRSRHFFKFAFLVAFLSLFGYFSLILFLGWSGI